MRVNLARAVPAFLVFALPLLIYILTLSPTVSFIDSGELAVVCYTLGISHPTGYPLYTLLGKIFTLLPLGTIIQRLNFLSALSAAAAILFLFLSLRNFLQKFELNQADSPVFSFGAAFLSLYFAFTPAIWSLAVTNEVYTLHILFLSLLLFLLLQWDRNRSEKLFFLICFLYGLSFTNHMNNLWLFPSLVILLWTGLGRRWLRQKRVWLGVVLFFLGFSLYLYLPIRSSVGPLFDWGHPTNWHNFKNHLSGWQYQGWMFRFTSEELAKNVESFGNLLLMEFPPLIMVAVVIGAVYLFWKDAKKAFALILLALLTLIYSVNFRIGEIENYFPPIYLSLTFFLASGLWVSLKYILRKLVNFPKSLALWVFATLCLLMFLLALLRNYHTQDRSKDYFAYDLAANILESTQAPALILTDVWDYSAPYLYIRFVEGKEQAKIILDKELLRRSWYSDFIHQAYPDIYQNSQKEIMDFQKAVFPFEHDSSYDPVYLDRIYQEMLASLIEQNLGTRNVYLLIVKPEPFRQKFLTVPEGLAFRVVSSTEYTPYLMPQFQLRGLDDPAVHKDPRIKFYLLRYPTMLEARAKYEAYFGYDSLAAALNAEALLLRNKLSD